MELLAAYLPTDRRHALARGEALPDHTRGAALLADISGFTPLTEALLNALGPQRGAEELSRQLNAVYSALISEVDRYRGSVLSFNGDAITCWFEDKHSSDLKPTLKRAVTCGLAMQNAMRPFAAFKTSTGLDVSLAMKVAIAAGPARRFVVGDPAIQRIDVLAGATLDRMAAAEKHAQRGEVVVSAETLAQLGGEAQVSREADAFVALSGLKRRARQKPWPVLGVDILPADQLRAWLLPPVYARLRDGQAQFLAEMRPAVALFMSFGGIDYDTDPHAGEALDAYLRRVQQVLNQHEAFVLQLTLGDKGCYLYAVFGAPLAHADDPARAVAAALELQAVSRDFDYIREVRIGLNQGRAWCGAYGGRTRHTYGVLGDAVNVAARLMGQAPPGHIYISASVAEAVRANYDLESVGALQLKGKAEPFPTFRVLSRRSSAVSILQNAITQPLVGRDRELKILNEQWQAAQGGASRLVRLTGAAGIGKSHLAQEFALGLVNQDARVCVGECHSTEQAVSYMPWRAVLLGLLKMRDDHLPIEQQAAAAQATLYALSPHWVRLAPLLGDVLNLPIPDNPTTAALDPQQRREAVWALVVDAVRAVANQQPLFIWLDGLQWMDEASRALTLAVSRALNAQPSPVLLLATQRPLLSGDTDPFGEWEAWPIHQALSLTELEADKMAALVQNRLDGNVRPLALALIQKQAQGNPFYAGELVEAMREAGHLVRRADGEWLLAERLFKLLQDQHCLMHDQQHGWWTLTPDAAFSAETLGIPDSLQRAITARVDQLSPEAQLTLKTASVIGPRFEIEILVLAHPRYPGREALESQLADLGQRGLLRRAEVTDQIVYFFEHNLIQEGIYNNLLADQQADLHATVGAALEEVRRDAVEQLAWHFSRANVRDKAFLYLGQAADKAKREYMNETALKYYEQALALETRWEWRKAQIEVLHILGRRAEQQAALKNFETLRGAPAFDAAYLWGQYYESISDYANALATLERACTIARERFHRVNEAASLNQLGLVAYRRGQYESARDWFGQARGVFPQRATHPPEEARLLAQASNGLGLAFMQEGNFGETVPCFQQALALYRQISDSRGEAQSLSNLGLAAYYQGQLPAAAAAHQQALELRRTIGDRAGQGSSLANLAQVTRDSGDYARAQQCLQQALQIQQEIGNRWGEANTWNDLGILHQELGRLVEAQECLNRGLELSRAIGDEAGEAYLLNSLGLVAADSNDLDNAERLLHQGLALARSQHDRRLEASFASGLSEVLRQKGQLEAAEEWASAALRIRGEFENDPRATDDWATLALIRLAQRDLPGAQDYARKTLKALEACEGIGPEFPQRDYGACYRVFDACGQSAEARAALRAAYDLMMVRATQIADSELRRSFLENAPRNHQVLEDAQRVFGMADPVNVSG